MPDLEVTYFTVGGDGAGSSSSSSGGGAVSSVNGEIGDVTLSAGDVPVTAAGPVTATDAQAALVELARGSLVFTPVKTAIYTATANDLVPCDISAGSFAVTLPDVPADRECIAVMVAAWADPYAVTVAAGAGTAFYKSGGPTSVQLLTLGQGVTLQYDSTAAAWAVFHSVDVDALDDRYGALPSLVGLEREYRTDASNDIGDGSAYSFTVTHNLAIPGIYPAQITVLDTATWWPINVDARGINANAVQVDFPTADKGGSPPTTKQYRVIVVAPRA